MVLIEAIKEKVYERYAQISGGVTKRGELTAEGLEESYVNESEYEKKEFVASKWFSFFNKIYHLLK